MKKPYLVTVNRFGFVSVMAESDTAALQLADHLTTDKINWSDDWTPTDAMEDTDHVGPIYEEPDFD